MNNVLGKNKQRLINTIVDRIIKIANPDKIILFGSYARGLAGENSDIDLMVVKKGVIQRRKLAQDIYVGLVGIPAGVDIIVETPERLEKYKTMQGMIYKYVMK